MKATEQQSRPRSAWSYLLLGCLAVGIASAVVVAQQNTVHTQPSAERLPSPAMATANRSQRVPQPEGILPTVPDGFSVASYAELQRPRMMAYAPNGDLFVSSPATTSIFVLRDADNDGVFEARGVFADGNTAPRVARASATRGGRPAPVLGEIEGPQSRVADPSACTPPPDYERPGPGGLVLPFGLAFHNGFLYVGNADSLVRFEYRSGDIEARGSPEKLLDLPTGGHSSRNIVVNRSGTKLYIAVGSESNSDAGEDCRRAAILEVNPDGTGARVYASGIRNPVGLASSPEPTWSGPRPTNATISATISCRTTRRRSGTVDSTAGPIPTSASTTIRSTSERSPILWAARSSRTCSCLPIPLRSASRSIPAHSFRRNIATEVLWRFTDRGIGRFPQGIGWRFSRWLMDGRGL